MPFELFKYFVNSKKYYTLLLSDLFKATLK